MLLKEGVIKAIKGFDFFFLSLSLFFFSNYYYLGAFLYFMCMNFVCRMGLLLYFTAPEYCS